MDASIRNVNAQESTLWQNIAGALFALAFIVFLITLTVASPGRATMLTGLLGMTGALLLVAVLRKVREFSIGPGGSQAVGEGD